MCVWRGMILVRHHNGNRVRSWRKPGGPNCKRACRVLRRRPIMVLQWKKLHWLRGAVAIVAGLLLVLALDEIARHFFDTIVNHGPLHDREPYWGELFFYVLFLMLGAPAGLLFGYALRVFQGSEYHTGGRAFGAGEATLELVAASAFAIFGSWAIGHWVTDFAWFTDDEQAYLYQAKLYQRGILSDAVMEPLDALRHPFVVPVGLHDGVQHWTGVYPVLQPLLMAASAKLGFVHLSQLSCVGLIVFHTGRLASELFPDSDVRRTATTAAWFCALSPMLLGLGATYHTAILATCLSVLALRLTVRLTRTWTLVGGSGLGLITGCIFLARPMEGTLLVLLLGGLLMVNTRRRVGRAPASLGAIVRQLPPIVGYGLGGLVPFAVFLLVNKAHTGRPLYSAYNILETIIGGFFGFGDGMMWGRTHTPLLALRQTMGALVRMNAWLLGWPSSLALWFLSVRRPYRSQTALLLLALSAVQLLAYMPLAFGSVHDFGSAYHVWHLPWVACISASVLGRMRVLGAGWRVGSVRMPAAAGAVGMTLAGIGAFWPIQIQRWRVVSDTILGPVRAAEAATVGVKAIVLWSQYLPPAPLRSWVHYPPAPDPADRIIWARYNPDSLPELYARYPERQFFGLSWDGETPVVLPLQASVEVFVGASRGLTPTPAATAEPRGNP